MISSTWVNRFVEDLFFSAVQLIRFHAQHDDEFSSVLATITFTPIS